MMPTAVISASTLRTVVDGLRRRMLGLVTASDVDDVAADTLTRAWELRDRFHGDRGELEAWVWGIAQNVAHELHRTKARTVQLADIDDVAGTDEIADVIARFEAREWLARVATYLTEQERLLLVAAADDSLSNETVARISGYAPRALIDAKTRVAVIAATVHAAWCRKAEGAPVTLRTVASCIPKDSAAATVLPAVMQHPPMGESDVATQLGISVRTVRNRLYFARELMRIAMAIVSETEGTQQ